MVVAILALGLIVSAAIGIPRMVSKRKAAQVATLRTDATRAFERGEFDQALATLTEADAVVSDDPVTLALMGRAYEASGNLTEAQKAYTKSIQADPDQAQVLYALAIIHKSTGDRDDAIDELARAVKAEPGFVGARLELAQLLAASGKTDAARSQYKAILELHPYGTDLKSVRKKMEALR